MIVIHAPLRHGAKAGIDAIDHLVARETSQEIIAVSDAFARRLIPY